MLETSFKPINTGASSYVYNSKCVTAFAIAAALSLAGCADVNAQFNPAKPHHTPESFKNNYTSVGAKSSGDFSRWQYQRLRAGLPKPPQTPTRTVAPQLEFLKSNAVATTTQPAITWVGHATMLAQAIGLNALTGLIFSEPASPVQSFRPKHAHPPGLSLKQLTAINVALLSHNHNDYLDKNTPVAEVNRAEAAPLFIVPLGVKKCFDDFGITQVKETYWRESAVVKGVEFNFTAVQHWSERGMGDTSQTPRGGWAVFGSDTHWYFSGDTGYSQDFLHTKKCFADRQTAARGGGFNIAPVAVGVYKPRGATKEHHVKPAKAVQIYKDLKAKRSAGVTAGVHWGSFPLTDEPLDQLPKELAIAVREQNLAADKFTPTAIGKTRKQPSRIAT